jgi:UDP-glucose 4-epimerase
MIQGHILVIGGAGFVGSNLVKMLLSEEGNQVTALDNLLSAEKENLPLDHPRLRFIQGSISDDRIVHALQDEYDYIFHLATFHGNQSSIFDPLRDHENNTITTLKLMEQVKDFKRLKKLVYSSAGCSVAEKTFDEAEATEEKEFTSIRHDSPYSISKIIGEFYCVYYFNQHKVPAVRARFQNVYGPGEVLGAGDWRGTYATVWRNVTPTFVYKAMKGMPMSIENEGIASRDFIFVDDICRGLIACAEKGREGEVYNIASGRETTIRELAELIMELTQSQSPLEFLPKRAWDNSGKRFGDPTKSRNELGFEAKTDIREGLEKTVAWTRENFDRIERTMHKHDEAMKAVGGAMPW